ncbi:hypothetical protein Heshes_26330 [Alicyclobacillus hesperidum]|uniref:Uncharacterized protein n=1 Tax=Alicyclobacillus hesperidum TaxID=89784 RepID=A0AA37X557_9BACL|nr:methylamine utilization protein MauJ [Alicyclobacillus hesperidum]GLV14948.1 hypothetical protein Heshes_26330 [Alicyclobacillus hesperidum]
MNSQTGEFSIDRPDIGGWETLIGSPVYADGREVTPEGEAGEYKVEFVLGPSKYQIDNIKIGFEADGDSFIQFRDPERNDPNQVVQAVLDCHGPGGERAIARAVCNKNGRMSKIVLDRVLADNRVHAEKIAYLLVSPVLSWISFAYDIPVEIVQTTTTELSTFMVATTVWMSPKIKGLDERFQLPNVPHNPRLLECIGQYREGLSSTNDIYSFLCFWKAYEGLIHIRQKLDKYIARNKLEGLPSRDALIPDDPSVRDTHAELIGRKLTYAHEQFRKTKRDAIAHLDTASGTYVSAHDLEQLYEIRRAIPVTRLIAKIAIMNELRIYERLIQLGHTECLRM